MTETQLFGALVRAIGLWVIVQATLPLFLIIDQGGAKEVVTAQVGQIVLGGAIFLFGDLFVGAAYAISFGATWKWIREESTLARPGEADEDR